MAPIERAALDREQLAAQYGWVHSVARNLVRDPWGAEDVTQETLLAALASPPPDVPDDQRLRAWLGRVAFNLSRLGMRQGARRRAREVRVARAEAMPSVSDELESAATVKELSRAIAALSEADRRVVLMRYFDGLSTAEIAAQMEVSELAVRKRLWRARNKLRADLEPDRRDGAFAALLLRGLWHGAARGARASARTGWKSLAGLAAGLALCVGAALWWSASTRASEPRTVSVASRVAAPRLRRPSAVGAPGAQLDGGSAAQDRAHTRSSSTPELPKAPPVKTIARGPQPVFAHGLALDLDGAARPGLAIVDSDASGSGAARDALATTDALGGFQLPVRERPYCVEARAEGMATILRARIESGTSDPALLLVAPARDLAGRVIDEDGLALADARLELVCDDSAFARVALPVRLESAVLAAFECDADGRFARPTLPRAVGLSLRIERAGYETLERPTLALGSEELFVLRATPTLAELSGTVRRQDGRAASGATVRLGRGTTTTDGRGRFRLALEGVEPDSSLEASDANAAPTRLPHFGSRVLEGRRSEIEIVLGEEHDAVGGRLVGARAGGWLVAAYPEDASRFDEGGHELAAASTRSAADGGFELSLPRGMYTLYALAPDAVRVVRRSGLDSRVTPWELALPLGPVLDAMKGQARTEDGEALAQARVDVAVLVDGAEGHRSLAWGYVDTDAIGQFGFPEDPGLDVALGVAHAHAAARSDGDATLAHALGHTPVDVVVRRPSWLQVGGASGAEACAVLDGDGRVLHTQGPVGSADRMALRDGQSAVVEVPSDARWLSVQRPGEEPVRVPIEPRPGKLLAVRP